MFHGLFDDLKGRALIIVLVICGVLYLIGNYVSNLFVQLKTLTWLLPVLFFVLSMVGYWFRKKYSYSIIEWFLEPFRKSQLPIYFGGEWESEYDNKGVKGAAHTITVNKKNEWYENGNLLWKIKAFKANDDNRHISFTKIGVENSKENKINKLFIIENGIEYKGFENGYIEVLYKRKVRNGGNGNNGAPQQPPPTIIQTTLDDYEKREKKDEPHGRDTQGRPLDKQGNTKIIPPHELPGLQSQPMGANASVHKVKDIGDYFPGKWLASFKLGGNGQTLTVEVRKNIMDKWQWFENGVYQFDVVNFDDSEKLRESPETIMLNFTKTKQGRNIKARLRVHDDGKMISGIEQNPRWGQVGITFTKIV